MILFSDEKEIIFKITNAVLLLWAIAATVIALGAIIDIVFKEPVRTYTYEEYKATNCVYFKGDAELQASDFDARCQADYNNYEFQNENSNHYKLRTFYVSLAHVSVVSGVMYFINKKKQK